MFRFKNIGNSCYLNSALQCLMRLPPLNDSLDDTKVAKTTPAQHFFHEYNDLRRMALDNNNCTISPALFRHAVQLYAKHKKNSDFAGAHQNDAAEFVQFVLHGIHEALARKEDFDSIPVDNEIEKKCVDMMKVTFSKEFSDMVHLFYGIQLSCIKDNITPESFLTLNLPIPNNATTLSDCMKAYLADETIEGWQNEKTGKLETVKKTVRFFRLPTVMFLCLKRFSSNGRKNDQYIDIPQEYELQGVMYTFQCGCYHQGSLNSGHYTAIVNMSGKWVVVDDDSTYAAQNISKNAYCLFYLRQN
jgi:ubiquitin C-terminal hydrolase